MSAAVDPETGESLNARGSNGHVDINHVKVVDRHRADLGDIDALAESIHNVGLLHPLVVDGDLRLIAGQRRLEACRRLGHPTVPVRVVRQVKDAAKALEAERDENTCRKAMTPTELASLTDSLLEIEKPKAAERQAEAGKANLPTVSSGHVPSTHADKGQALDKAAEAAGWSRRSYQRTKRVQEAMNDTDLPESVRKVAEQQADLLALGETTPKAADTALADAKVEAGIATTSQKVDKAKRDAPKDDNPRSLANVAKRRAQIKELAAKGYTSRQIGAEIGLGDETVRTYAKEDGVELADALLGRPRLIDANRVLSEAVIAVEGAAMGVGLIDLTALDATQLEGWVTSLSNSLRSLNRFHKQLKEMTP